MGHDALSTGTVKQWPYLIRYGCLGLVLAALAIYVRSIFFSVPLHPALTHAWLSDYLSAFGAVLTLCGMGGYLGTLVLLIKTLLKHGDLNSARMVVLDVLFFSGCMVLGNVSIFARLWIGS